MNKELVITIFGLIGSFAIPALTFADKNLNIYSASYLLILSAIFVLISLIKDWKSLCFLAFLGIIFYMQSLSKLIFSHQLIIIGCIFIIFNLIPYIYSLFFNEEDRLLEPMIISSSGLYCFIKLYNQIETYYLHVEPLYSTIFTVIDQFLKPFKAMYTNTVSTKILTFLFLGFGLFYLIEAVILFLFNKSKKYLLCTLIILGISFIIGLMALKLNKVLKLNKS